MASLGEELKIVISGDPKEFNKALSEIQKETKRLEAGLSATAKISGAAFVALSGTIGALTAAYRAQEVEEQKTKALIAATGGAAGQTAKDIFEMASSLQEVTLFGDEVVLTAQNILLGFTKIGKEVFPQATEAALDLATFLGTDLKAASLQLGKALDDPIEGLGGLGRAGIKFTNEQEQMIRALVNSGQQAKAQGIILDALNGRIGGLARGAVDGTGKFVQFGNILGDISEEIGRHLTPIIGKAVDVMAPFFQSLSRNEELLKTVAAVLAIGTAVTGVVFGFSAGALAILKFTQIVRAATVVMTGLQFSIRGVIGATGIGLLVIAISDFAVNWEKRIMQAQAVWAAFAASISQIGSGISGILSGILDKDLGRIEEGFGQIKGAGSTFVEEYSRNVEAAAERELATTQEKQDQRNQIISDGDKEALAQQTAYLEALRKLDEEHQQLMNESNLSDKEVQILAEKEFQNRLLEARNEAKALNAQENLTDQQLDQQLEQEHQNELLRIKQEGRVFDLDADRQIRLEKAKAEQKERQTRLIDEKKHGIAVANMKALFRSQEFQATQEIFQNLSVLTQSKNKQLFQIGKAAAYANAIINVAQGVTKTLAQYPFPISVALAAAQAAAGAVQIATISAQKMAQGGLVEGGILGKDSVPILAQQGELVVPRQNFDEVVRSVAQTRGLIEDAGRQMVEVVVGFTDNAFHIIEQKLNERRALGV